MQLVDEEHDVASAALDFVENAFDAPFELAAIFRARNERPEREREDALSAQRRRRVAADDALRQPFDDRGLADAGLADEARDCSCCAARGSKRCDRSPRRGR